MKKKSIAVMLCVLGAAGIYLWVQAGDLEPPGPPAPTMKTLDQVEPRTPIHASDLPLTITQPGSYYLAEDIVAIGEGITIATDGVTIDLMGFRLQGAGGGNGIQANGAYKYIAVRNGTVSGWQHGVILADCFDVIVSNIRAQDNWGEGIAIGQGKVDDCLAISNGNMGIVTLYSGGVVTNSVADANAQYGIYVGPNSSVIDCHCRDNSYGIVAFQNSTIKDSVTIANEIAGIYVLGYSHVVGNTSNLNQYGIQVEGAGNRIEANHVTGNSVNGIYGFVAAGGVVVRNTASGNGAGDFNVSGGYLGTPVDSETAMNSATNDLINISF